MDAGHYFVPLIVVSIPADIKNQPNVHPSGSKIYMLWLITLTVRFSDFPGLAWTVYLGRVAFTIPVGRISSDLPQNLFFHRWSVREHRY